MDLDQYEPISNEDDEEEEEEEEDDEDKSADLYGRAAA